MTALCNTSVGENRGTSRIWLEGEKLARGGFNPGDSYNRRILPNKIVLQVVSDGSGEYTVSKRVKNELVKPIIDIKTKEIESTFCSIGDEIRVFIRNGIMVISESLQSVKVAERVERFLHKLDTNQNMKIASAFSGGGVLDRAMHEGFEKAGIKSILSLAIEIEPAYLDSSMRNNPMLWDEDSIAIESKIERVDFSRNLDMTAEGCYAGIPCTGASVSGRSKNGLTYAEEHSKVGGSIFYFLNLIQSLNPAFIVIENVVPYSNTASAALLRSVLRSMGFTFSESTFTGAEFGALENRKRWTLVAITEGLNDIVEDFNIDNLEGNVHDQVGTLSDVLEEVPLDSNAWKTFSYLADKEKRDIAAGKGFRRQLVGGSVTSVGTIGAGYAKARSTEVFLKHPTNPDLSRLLTVNEHAAVKGIPKDIVNGLSATIAHQVLGQSVCYNKFVAIGECLAKHFNTIRESRSILKAV